MVPGRQCCEAIYPVNRSYHTFRCCAQVAYVHLEATGLENGKERQRVFRWEKNKVEQSDPFYAPTKASLSYYLASSYG